MPRLPAVAIATALTLTACGFGVNPAPVCGPGMPAATQLLAEPALEPLKYYTRVNFEVNRGTGSDLWADAKFAYGAALQYSLVPYRPTAAEGGQYCAKAIALQLAWPLDEARSKMLAAFVARVSAHTGVDPQALQATLDSMIAKDERYRNLVRQGKFTVEGGRISHPNRGEFFTVGFDWSSTAPARRPPA